MSMKKNLNRQLQNLSILGQSKEGVGEKKSEEKPDKVGDGHDGSVSN